MNERDIFSGVVASSVCENSPRPASLTSSIWITYWWPIFTPLLVTWFASGVALYRDEHTQHSERYLRKKCQLIRKLVLKNIVCHLSILYQTIQKLIFGFKVYLLNIKITSLNRFIWLEHNQNYYLKTWRFDLCQRPSSEEAGTQFFRFLTQREDGELHL